MRHATPSKKKQNRSEDWGHLLLILALFIFIFALFIDGKMGEQNSSSVGRVYDSNDELTRKQKDKLSYEIKRSHIESENRRRQLESKLEVQDRIESHTQYDNDSREVLPLSNSHEVPPSIREIEEEQHSRSKFRANSPETRVSKKLDRDKWLREYDKSLKEEYVNQFLENARQGGVDVRLNENLDVTGINRIQMEEPIRFPQSVDSPKGPTAK